MVTCKPFQSRYKVHTCHHCGSEIPLGRWAYRAASKIYCSACKPDEHGNPQPKRKPEEAKPRTGKHAPPDPTASRSAMPGENAAIRCADGVWRYEHDSVSSALRSALDDYAQNVGTQEYLRERLKRALSGKDHWANRFTKAKLLQQLRRPSAHLLEAVDRMRAHLIDQVAAPVCARRRVLRGQEFGETLDAERWLARSLEPWERSIRDVQPRRTVTIGCNLSVNAAIKPGQLLYRGAAALALADMLSTRGINVGIALFDSRTHPTKTVEKLVVRHNVKDPMMPLDPSTVALSMCEIGYFRIVCALGGMRHIPGRMNSGLGCASRLPESDRADLDYLIESDVLSQDALVKAGVPQEDLEAEQPFGPVVFSYSRADAIRDGVLVDVTHLAAARAGFTIPVALTCGVVAQIAGRFDDPKAKTAALLVVLQELRQQIRRSILSGTDTDRICFQVGLTRLWALCGPGDEAEPVLTVMLEGED